MNVIRMKGMRYTHGSRSECYAIVFLLYLGIVTYNKTVDQSNISSDERVL
jgi:hypothetical protein